jgi:hypothetical protein
MTEKLGHFKISQPPIQEHPQIGNFLSIDPGFYAKVAETTDLIPCTNQIHYAYKPHKVGNITLQEGTFEVWGDKGLSPCIRTQNRIFIAMEIGIVEITVEGMAALQGIPLHELPPDRKQARKTIGNGVHRAMQYWVDAHALDYTNNFLRLPKEDATKHRKPRGWSTQNKISEPLKSKT